MIALIWTLIGFFLGSLPLSVWLGRLVLKTDIRRYGDGNPGGTNVARAGNTGLTPVVLAPILGHAFSPFLGFRGGKALACTFGAWSVLTVPFGPFVMGGSVFVFYKLFPVSGWAVMASLLMLLLFLLIAGATLPLLAAWAGTVAILAWTHRADLRQPPRFGRTAGRQP